MIKQILKIFDLSPEQAKEINAIELKSRGKALLVKADRAHTKAEQQVKKAETDLWASTVLNNERHAEYKHAKRQRPSSRKATDALQYVTNLKLAAKRWGLSEQLVARERERLIVARKALQGAKASQKEADVVIRRANSMTAKKEA